jgi:hypothetical protein
MFWQKKVNQHVVKHLDLSKIEEKINKGIIKRLVPSPRVHHAARPDSTAPSRAKKNDFHEP